MVGGCQTPIKVDHVISQETNRPVDACSILSEAETVHNQAEIFNQDVRSETDPTIYHVEMTDDSVDVDIGRKSC